MLRIYFSRNPYKYWDWSLDWSSFRDAPVWDPSTGLGGDGPGSGSVGDGKCVTSGPFSELEVMFYDNEVLPHCLSRSFPEKEELKGLGELIRPEAINDLMKENVYEGFASELEKRAHKFLSHSVRGDLSRFTGPNGNSPLVMPDLFESHQLTSIHTRFFPCTMLILTGFGRSGSCQRLKIDLPLIMEELITTPKKRQLSLMLWIWAACRQASR